MDHLPPVSYTHLDVYKRQFPYLVNLAEHGTSYARKEKRHRRFATARLPASIRLEPSRIGCGSPGTTGLYPRASAKAKGLKRGKGTGTRGKALPEKAKRPPEQPVTGVRHALAVPAQKGFTDHRRAVYSSHRTHPGPDAAAVGVLTAGHTPPTTSAGTHLAADLALAPAVHRTVPRAAEALRLSLIHI